MWSLPGYGVLEWVPDTIPLGAYLRYAHKKYNPKDTDLGKCREVMQAENDRVGWTKQSKLIIYNKVGNEANLGKGMTLPQPFLS